MIRPKKIFLVLAGILLVAGCTKEYSSENGGSPLNGAVSPPLGDNCRLEKIVSVDSASGIGLASLYTQFDVNDLATRIELFDSLAQSLTFAVNFVYASDSIRLNANEYFVLDPSYRIKEFKTLLDPTNAGSGALDFKYYYDANGYLVNKQVYQESIPVPITVNYQWTSGNLVSIDASIAGQLKVLTAQIEYDPNKTAKNFMYILPEAYELFPYILAVNLGNKSKNLVKKIVMNIYDSTGNVSKTYTNTFSNFKFSADGYVMQLYASGDPIEGLLLLNGLTKFSYKCK